MTAPAPLPLQREETGPFAGITTLRLEQPGRPVVVLDHDLLRRLEATLASLPRGLVGLVVASASERVFVAGADLKTISDWPDDQLTRYLEYGSRVFGMLAALPFPTVAAINGAALGGGLELALHCDGLVACPAAGRDGQPGKPYPIGLPEASLGLCPGWGGTNLLPARMDPAEAIRRTISGAPMLFAEAKAAGLFDAVADGPGSLLTSAKGWIAGANSGPRTPRDGAPPRWIGRSGVAARVLAALDGVKAEASGESARGICEAIDAGLARGWGEALRTEQRWLVRLRHTPAAREALAAFFAKSAPKA